jgi:acetyltransferase-like isoleucine patch superfamily enzyme
MFKIIAPKLDPNENSVKLTELIKKEGEDVSKGDIIFTIESTKADMDVEAEESGHIFYIADVGDKVNVGDVIAVISSEKSIDKTLFKNIELKKDDSSLPFNATKKAIEFAKKNNIDLVLLNKKGIIKEVDVVEYINKTKKSTKKNVPGPRHKYDNERIVIVCASNISAEVINDILESQSDKIIIGYIVDDAYKKDSDLNFLNSNVFDFPQKINKGNYDTVIIAMGGSLKSMKFRKKIFDHYIENGINFTNVISKKANIGKNVSFGVGNIIGSGVYIGTGSVIGNNNFISYMTTIGHHNTIGDHNLFAPGVMMSGLVEVGDECILTTGVNFIDRVKIGSNVILPLGYNVTSDIEDGRIIKIKW